MEKLPESDSTGADLAELLWHLPPDHAPEPLAARLAADIALSATLEQTLPELPFSLSAGLSRRIAAEAGEAQAEAQDPVAALLRAQPRPSLPVSQAAALAQAIAQQSITQQSITQQAAQPVAAPSVAAGLGPVGGVSVLAGLNVLLAFGGLTVLGHLASQPSLPHTLALGSGKGLGLVWTGPSPWFAALATPANVFGLTLLIVGSALLVWRPSLKVRRGAGLLLAVAAVLTLPAVWDSLHSLGLSHAQAGWSAAVWPLVVAGLLLQMALLLLGGQAPTLVRRQTHFPLQTLAAGTLTELGLLGLGLLLLALGWSWTAPLLGLTVLLAAVVGLGVSLLSLGRTLRRHLLPTAPRWLAGLASLGIFGVSLNLPPLAALLLLIGGAWGLGSVVTGLASFGLGRGLGKGLDAPRGLHEGAP